MKLTIEYIINCVDCSTPLGRVKLPDGKEYPGDKHYGFVCYPCSDLRAEAAIAKEIAESMGADSIEAELKPGLWDRIVSFFTGGR